jgi:NADPH:quinone reductase-like Zn-dependent oxidoreductase
MRRSSHAEYVTVPANQLAPRPAAVPWEVAGSLFVAGATAYAAVRAVRLQPGDTVAIAGAVGGVGSIVVPGGGYVAMAVEDLKVPRDRVDTITDFGAVERYGVLSAGGADAATAAVVAELADLVAQGELEVPIAGVFALDDVRDAYQELEMRHTRGKLVLRP